MTVSLGSVGATYGGLTAKSGKDFGHGVGRYVTFTEVMAASRLVGRSLECVDVRKGERQNEVRRDDVLFNGSSETPEEVALGAVVDFDVPSGVYLNSFCFGYRLTHPNVVDPTYLAYFFRSAVGRDVVFGLAQGATRYNISKTKLLRVELDLPSFNEQKAVAAALAQVDDLISAIVALIAKKHAIKYGLTQELIQGRTRLLGSSGAWSDTPIESLIDGLAAGTSVRSNDGATGPAVLKTSSVRAGKFDSREAKTILAQDLARASCEVVADSMIISRMNTPAMVGDVGYVEAAYPGLYLPDRLWLARSRPGSGTSMRWLTAVLSSGATARSVRDLATGTSNSMKNIPKKRLLALCVPTPPHNEQHAIAEVLQDADAEIEALGRRLDATRAIKQGMMQELLTGRTCLAGKGAA